MFLSLKIQKSALSLAVNNISPSVVVSTVHFFANYDPLLLETSEEVSTLQSATSAPVAPMHRLNPNCQLLFVPCAIHRGLSRPTSEGKSTAYMLDPLGSDSFEKAYSRRDEASSSISATVFMLPSSQTAIQTKQAPELGWVVCEVMILRVDI